MNTSAPRYRSTWIYSTSSWRYSASWGIEGVRSRSPQASLSTEAGRSKRTALCLELNPEPAQTCLVRRRRRCDFFDLPSEVEILLRNPAGAVRAQAADDL